MKVYYTCLAYVDEIKKGNPIYLSKYKFGIMTIPLEVLNENKLIYNDGIGYYTCHPNNLGVINH